jgi:hypothetical protein
MTRKDPGNFAALFKKMQSRRFSNFLLAANNASFPEYRYAFANIFYLYKGK